jgi:hypothetical protein
MTSMAKQFISVVTKLQNFVNAHQMNDDYLHEYLNLHMAIIAQKWWWNQDKDAAATMIHSVLNNPSYSDKLKNLVQFILDTFIQLDDMDEDNDDFPLFSNHEYREYVGYGY